MNEKTWQKNAPSQITLNSIFAAMCGVLIALAIQDKCISDELKLYDLAFLLLAFVLFAVSAEQTVTALDEQDVKKYVYYMLLYNFGVILTAISIAIIIYAHFSEKSFSGASICPIVILFATFIIFLCRRIWTIRWLLSPDKTSFTNYLDELEDKVQPVPERSRLMERFYKWKGIE